MWGIREILRIYRTARLACFLPDLWRKGYLWGFHLVRDFLKAGRKVVHFYCQFVCFCVGSALKVLWLLQNLLITHTIKALDLITARCGYTLNITLITYILMQSHIYSNIFFGLDTSFILLDQVVFGLCDFELLILKNKGTLKKANWSVGLVIRIWDFRWDFYM